MRPHSIRGLLGIAAVLVAALVVALAFGVSTDSPTAQAQSADDDPRLINITNLDQLNAVRYDPDGDGTVPGANQSLYEAAFPDAADRTCADGCTGYELMTDLDFEGSDYATGSGWIPVEEFDAIFDGNGKTISNLFIDMDTDGTVNVGLFAELSVGAVIRNLSLTDVAVTVTNGGVGTAGVVAVGGLIGRNDGTVENIYVTGQISVSNTQRSTDAGGLLGRSNGTTTASGAAVEVSVQGGTGVGTNAGGLVGSNSSGQPTDIRPNPLIRDSYAIGHVTVSTSAGYPSRRAKAGGLVGYNDGTIVGSYATGNASAASGYDATEESRNSVVAGGLAGQSTRFIGASYATGDATATGPGDYTNARAGGLVGSVGGPTGEDIVASYATGRASATSHTGEESVGGLIGSARSRPGVTITASYSTGSVRATATEADVGGLVGFASTTTAPHSYWDVDASGHDTSAVGSGRTTVALQDPTSRSADNIYAGWNVDVDNADGDDDLTTGVDDPWDFGESWQYPVLKYGILDPAMQRAKVTLVLSEASIDEAGGETTVTATQDRVSNLPTEVTVSVPAGSPVTLSENTKLTIPAGETESTGTVKIRGVDDGDTTDDKTVEVSGQVAAGGSGANNPDAVDLTVLDSMRVTNVRVRPKTTLAVVSWDALEGADGYRVQWKYGGRDWSEDRQQEVSSTATTLRRLRPGTEYTVRVSAADAGAWSVPVTLTTEDPEDDEGASPFATMTPTPTATPAVPAATPIPPTEMIATSTATTLMSADGHVTLEFPAGSRSDPYQVNSSPRTAARTRAPRPT